MEGKLIYPLFKFESLTNYRVLGIYLTEEAGREALIKCPDDDNHEYQLEEWPANEPPTRFNIRVVDSK